MKTKILYSCIAALFTFSSCSDFLDREPLSDNVDEGSFTTEGMLEAYCNAKYDLLPDFASTKPEAINPFTLDANSDNQTNASPIDAFLLQRVVVPGSGSYNLHEKLRDCNRFLYNSEKNQADGSLENNDKIKQYIGEIYFFRAYIYFSYLQKFGDFPIVDQILNDADYATNVEANKRKPRNEVARFILTDLDKAIERLQPQSNKITTHRINKETAYLFKSRVALYEGTWETYHKGTARVPGGPNWPGGTFNGNLDTEISFFLGEAMSAAKVIADAVALDNDYISLFNQDDLSSRKEVLLWRMYSSTASVQHLVEGSYHTIVEEGVKGQPGYTLFSSGGGANYTRSLVESFLMKSGLPIYADSDYKGDKSLNDVVDGRDNRLVSSMSVPGDLIWRGNNMDKEYVLDLPGFTTKHGLSTTGYLVRKGWRDSKIAPNDNSSMAMVLFRAGEAYLNYIEADYVKNKSLDANSQKYWKALRQRAGVDTDFQKTIRATDLSKEPDLAKYSGGVLVDATLYNIRRERRNEFIAEGMRKNDLYRWRALDTMKDYQIEGMNLYDEYYSRYEKYIRDGSMVVVSQTVSKYLRPLFLDALAKNGYTFEQANYLSPLSYDIFRLSTPDKGGDVSTSVVYQNPGWPVEKEGTAIQ